MCAVQFAVAKGALVVATTSSDDKSKILKDMGVAHVINYRKDPSWGETAKKFVPDGEGFHHIIEVGGNNTITQSIRAIRPEGVISMIGFLAAADEAQKSSFLDVLKAQAVIMAIGVGSKQHFNEMNAFIDEHKIKPVVDLKTFPFEEAKAVYEYLQHQKHVGKIVIEVGSA